MDARTAPSHGSRVLVTGAARGIGAACAARFASLGATVYVTDVDDEGGRAVADTLGPSVRYLHLDVASEAEWDACVQRIEADGGGLDVLVANAGAAHRGDIADTSLADFRRMLDINLVGTFLALRTASTAVKSGGSVITVSSLRGILATAKLGAYGASKFGVRALTRVAALELAERGIRVNSVCPGSIDTDITGSEDFADHDVAGYVRTIPMQRRGTTGDIADAVVFLAGSESSYITGTDLVVDGGLAAGARTPTHTSGQKA
ncbi:SDR family oxidoreductase [Rhodococcus sp. BP-316]|uniref:SDR family NAD(P)-dependent oxidoreductase n=1 Tax=Rhodococcus sp. BP-316 TaxID=2739445 RepID=UPI001C9B4369|nr:SDR family oxidoreductase [Rhodococcus sp. BP-316]MBY6682914.1 SDR family oxidoreductase [Rhodococcus sp. BP-316]